MVVLDFQILGEDVAVFESELAVIRRVSIDEDYAIDPKELLFECFGSDGGPYCRHLHSEAVFNSYDSSCRKFYKFMKREWED